MEETKTNNEYTWKDFTHNNLYDPLIKFFIGIIHNKDSDIIFVSRKAYCLFLLMKEKYQAIFEGLNIYTDRVILSKDKPLGENVKNVILVDDTIHTGDNLFDACYEVVTKTQYTNILLTVFLGDEDFDVNGFKKRVQSLSPNVEFTLYSEQKKLYSAIRNEQQNDQNTPDPASFRLRFSAIETLLFHENGIPYCAELPILKEEIEKINEEPKCPYEILFTKEQYQMLQKEDKSWKFIKCDQMGFQQTTIENAVFTMKHGSFYGAVPEFIYDFVIRAQINQKSDDQVGIVFSPFAILKSVKYDELEDFFFHIFEDTPYINTIQSKKEAARSDFKNNYYKVLYRSIVYVYSYCAGYIFKNYLKKITDKQVVFQDMNDKYCFDPLFIESVKLIFSNGVNDLFLKTFLFRGFTDVEKYFNAHNFTSKYGRISNTYSGVYYFLWSAFNEFKRARGRKADTGRKSFLSLEELQEAIYISSSGSFDIDVLKDTFTACLCAMLEQSKITNDFYFDAEKQIVYRGFKYAENGEATFELQEKIMYIAFRAYLMKLKGKGFTQEEIEEVFSDSYNYKYFLLMMRDWLTRNNLWNNIITPEAFSMYAEHYKKSIFSTWKELDFLVEDKSPVYVSMIEEYIYSLKI